MDARLEPSHPFGQRFTAAKENFIKARRIYWDGRMLRNKAIDLPIVPLGILPKMINCAKTNNVAVTTLAGGFGGFEVSFRSTTIPGYPAPYDQQISMLWEDSSVGKDWDIGPISLSASMDLKKSKSQKQLLHFIPSGLDIRDTAGKPLGTHKPLFYRSVKTETLPIASIILSVNESSNPDAFLAHWQEVVTVDLDAIWEVRQTNAA
jgi:hypothetical protein